MNGRGKDMAFTVIELVLVIAIIMIIVAILWPFLGTARKASFRTSCASNLRQIGMAYQMYVADYGKYPVGQTTMALSPYINDKQILYCPEDAFRLSASSYAYRFWLPPNFTNTIDAASYIDPSTVLVVCDVHARKQVISVKDDDPKYTPPQYPYHLVLRASGAVEQVHISRIKKFPFTFDGKSGFIDVYPGEPGYEKAK